MVGLLYTDILAVFNKICFRALNRVEAAARLR
jgi:hypothetical protein